MKGRSNFKRKTATQQVLEIENRRLQYLLAQTAYWKVIIYN
jgi:hypothetical protein